MNFIRNWIINLGLIFLSIILSVICVEIFLRFTQYKSFITSAPYQVPRYYYKAEPITGYDISENFPKGAFTPQWGTKYDIWSNELGCFDLQYKGEKDTILLVGDSFTHSFAPFDNLWGTLIERYLDYRVLKCGVGGYGTKEEFIKAKRVISKINSFPKLIIVGYHLNDLNDDYVSPHLTVVDGFLINVKEVDWETGEFIKRKDDLQKVVEEYLRNSTKTGSDFFTVKNEEQKATNNSRDSKKNSEKFIERTKGWLLQHSIIYNLAKDVIKKAMLNIPMIKDFVLKFGIVKLSGQSTDSAIDLSFYPVDSYPWLKKAWDSHLENLKAFKELTNKNGAKLLIVLFPTKYQVYPFLLKGDFVGDKKIDLELPNKILSNFFSKEEVSFIDLLPLFRRYSGKSSQKWQKPKKVDLYWTFDVHINPKGNRLTALLVAQYILENNLLAVSNKDERLKTIKEQLEEF